MNSEGRELKKNLKKKKEKGKEENEGRRKEKGTNNTNFAYSFRDRLKRLGGVDRIINFCIRTCTLKWHAGRISSILDDVDQEYALCNWNIKGEIPFQRKKKEKKYSIKFKKGNENTNYLGCDWSSWVRASILVVNR